MEPPACVFHQGLWQESRINDRL
ncbi:protein of unknown function [Sterolibacterium denitrificans]|uniref:Uncharacterized protein n=1 Tax=Sterolibacterium denitrificans TaxID=157592 RepID=A0A7Z7HRG6_9PROT|nr:protein of unknown function [Sterolibacterium denitrificans]